MALTTYEISKDFLIEVFKFAQWFRIFFTANILDPKWNNRGKPFVVPRAIAVD